MTDAAAQSMFSYAQKYPRPPGDVDGDGRDVVVGFGCSATTVRLSWVCRQR
ncbi:hypothetical protein ACT4S5_01935 [Kocuria oceani]|uniref:hypothetical protein n=1 Tax=Kocuria oceani TaxID=988827 RepID=UPI00403640C0